MGIDDQEIKELRNKVIPMIKVLWWSDTVEETIWETEAFMKTQIDANLFCRDLQIYFWDRFVTSFN